MERSPIAKPKTVEVIRNEKVEENIRRISLSDIDRNYEDMIRRQREQRQAANGCQKELTERFKKNMLERAYQNQA